MTIEFTISVLIHIIATLLGSLAIIWLYLQVFEYRENKKWRRYEKAMDEKMKSNAEAFNKALLTRDPRKCDQVTRQFENWCKLNEPR